MSYGLQRLDSLVPQLARRGKKAVLRRETHEPLVLDGTVRSMAPHPVRSHGAYFWNSFLPACLEEFGKSGRLGAVGSEEVQAEQSLPNSATY